jgi:hypothetical protein
MTVGIASVVMIPPTARVVSNQSVAGVKDVLVKCNHGVIPDGTRLMPYVARCDNQASLSA